MYYVVVFSQQHWYKNMKFVSIQIIQRRSAKPPDVPVEIIKG